MGGNIAQHERHEGSLLQIVVNSIGAGIHDVIGKSRFRHSICFRALELSTTKLEADQRSQMKEIGQCDGGTDGSAKWLSLSSIGNCQLDFFEPRTWIAWQWTWFWGS